MPSKPRRRRDPTKEKLGRKDSILPGHTLATVFLADLGPVSILEYPKFGFQPALVPAPG